MEDVLISFYIEETYFFFVNGRWPQFICLKMANALIFSGFLFQLFGRGERSPPKGGGAVANRGERRVMRSRHLTFDKARLESVYKKKVCFLN